MTYKVKINQRFKLNIQKTREFFRTIGKISATLAFMKTLYKKSVSLVFC